MNTLFTAQEWRYLASGQRALPAIAEADAARQDNPGIRQTFVDAERVYRELAAKCDSLARESAEPGALELPVFRQLL